MTENCRFATETSEQKAQTAHASYRNFFGYKPELRRYKPDFGMHRKSAELHALNGKSPVPARMAYRRQALPRTASERHSLCQYDVSPFPHSAWNAADEKAAPLARLGFRLILCVVRAVKGEGIAFSRWLSFALHGLTSNVIGTRKRVSRSHRSNILKNAVRFARSDSLRAEESAESDCVGCGLKSSASRWKHRAGLRPAPRPVLG
jgi:hypothetical protein